MLHSSALLAAFVSASCHLVCAGANTTTSAAPNSSTTAEDAAASPISSTSAGAGVLSSTTTAEAEAAVLNSSTTTASAEPTVSSTAGASTTTTGSLVQHADGNFSIGEEVFALHKMSYITSRGRVHVLAGDRGKIVCKGQADCNFKIQVQWAELNMHSLVEEDDIESTSCLGACEGLVAFLGTAGAVSANASLNQADRCWAMQGHHLAAACAAAPEQERRCPATWSRAQTHSKVCASIGVNMTSASLEALALFGPVVAMVDLSYATAKGPVTIPFGTAGHVEERGERIVVRWDIPQAFKSQVDASQIEYMSCMGYCSGLEDFLATGMEVLAGLGWEHWCQLLEGLTNGPPCIVTAQRLTECSTLRNILGGCISTTGGVASSSTPQIVGPEAAMDSSTPSSQGTSSTTTELQTSTLPGGGRNSSGEFQRAVAVDGAWTRRLSLWTLLWFMPACAASVS
eukprot:TRINITY_DN41631_c0_g1_i1.p1 TRINITY_DN41631_c0_g1~~TRINITY_DN41631_c0_g1_i1.p1  ORF type:complete len:465 (-),score=84.79 TRINITY_DN41631_c0_g1_i1:55-1425(-)